MKAIHNKVNVVPVIAKADTLTLRERERLKRRVKSSPRLHFLTHHRSNLELYLEWLHNSLFFSFSFFNNAKILDEIDEHGIKIYHLPDAESDEDEDFKEQTRILKVVDSPHCSSLITFSIKMPKVIFSLQDAFHFNMICDLLFRLASRLQWWAPTSRLRPKGRRSEVACTRGAWWRWRTRNTTTS